MIIRQIKYYALRLDPMRALPIALVSLVIVTAVVDILLAFQPAVISPLRDGFQNFVGAGTGLSSWPGLFAASISVLSVSVAAAILAAFIRGVKDTPYRWLAPLLVSFCMMLITGLATDLPWSAPTPLFAVISALLIVGGGEVFLLGSVLRILIGLTLIFTPILLLAFGYLQSSPNTTFDSDARLITAILALSSFGTLAISVVSQRIRQEGSRYTAAEEESDYLRSKIVELNEKYHNAQARALHAEQQVAELQAYAVHQNQYRQGTH